MTNELIYELMKDNKGLTSDDPIILICSICKSILIVPDVANTSRIIPCCRYCSKHYLHTYTYIKDKWYYCETNYDAYIAKHIGAPYYWEYNMKIRNYNPVKALYEKYKNDPIIAPQIMAEILGNDE